MLIRQKNDFISFISFIKFLKLLKNYACFFCSHFVETKLFQCNFLTVLYHLTKIYFRGILLWLELRIITLKYISSFDFKMFFLFYLKIFMTHNGNGNVIYSKNRLKLRIWNWFEIILILQFLVRFKQSISSYTLTFANAWIISATYTLLKPYK